MHMIQLICFGAEHEKGEADGETGVISKAIDAAVLYRQLVVRDANDFYAWCVEHLTKNTVDS